MAAPADLLLAQAADFGATLINRSGGVLRVAIDVLRADGKVSGYRLLIDTSNAKPAVKELAPTHLPPFCPNRHINADGTFCLTWDVAAPLAVADAAGAERWWGTLVQFLKLQERAAKRRGWPNGHQWAHGDAARYQLQAEQSSGKLGAGLVIALRDGRLAVRRSGPFLRLLLDGRRLYSVWVEGRRTATLRQKCPCRSGKVIRACADHKAASAELAFAVRDMNEAEAEFWEGFSGRTCCGTLNDCPLAARK